MKPEQIQKWVRWGLLVFLCAILEFAGTKVFLFIVTGAVIEVVFALGQDIDEIKKGLKKLSGDSSNKSS